MPAATAKRHQQLLLCDQVEYDRVQAKQERDCAKFLKRFATLIADHPTHFTGPSFMVDLPPFSSPHLVTLEHDADTDALSVSAMASKNVCSNITMQRQIYAYSLRWYALFDKVRDELPAAVFDEFDKRVVESHGTVVRRRIKKEDEHEHTTPSSSEVYAELERILPGALWDELVLLLCTMPEAIRRTESPELFYSVKYQVVRRDGAVQEQEEEEECMAVPRFCTLAQLRFAIAERVGYPYLALWQDNKTSSVPFTELVDNALVLVEKKTSYGAMTSQEWELVQQHYQHMHHTSPASSSMTSKTASSFKAFPSTSTILLEGVSGGNGNGGWWSKIKSVVNRRAL